MNNKQLVNKITAGISRGTRALKAINWQENRRTGGLEGDTPDDFEFYVEAVAWEVVVVDNVSREQVGRAKVKKLSQARQKAEQMLRLARQLRQG